MSVNKLFERIDRIIGEADDEEKHLTKKQQRLPEKLKKKIIASKKKEKGISEDVGLVGCNDCGSRVPTPSSLPAPCPDCGSTIKRSYSFRRSTPGRKKRKPKK